MIYISDISDFDDSFFETAIEILPPEKKDEIKRISHIHARNESILAWVLLKFALEDINLKSFPKLFFTERGKPYFLDNKAFFNLSHSGDKVCVAISKVSEIGVDIQKASNFSQNMIKRVFNENECVAAELMKDSNRVFTRLWAIKESYLKYTGTGIAYDLKLLDYSDGINCDFFQNEGLYFSVFSEGSYFISACTKEKKKQNLKSVFVHELISYVKKITASAVKESNKT